MCFLKSGALLFQESKGKIMITIEKRHIVATPNVLGGKPRIDGTRIAVEHIAIAYNSGQRPEEIVDNYEGILLSDVFAALTYYFDHKDEIDKRIEEGKKFVKKLRNNTPPDYILVN